MAEHDLDEREQREHEERQAQGQPSLDQEIALRYDPQRLAKLVVKGAGRGERLDLATQGEMARILPGQDFSSVRVFRGAFAEEITERHKADAVTIANTGMILMRSTPRSAPGTTSGRALLAHELTHVAQARRGMHFALAHEHGHGEHEHEAEGVESEVSGGGGPKHDPIQERLKEERRRRAVIERAMELMAEDQRLQRERSGGGWEG